MGLKFDLDYLEFFRTRPILDSIFSYCQKGKTNIYVAVTVSTLQFCTEKIGIFEKNELNLMLNPKLFLHLSQSFTGFLISRYFEQIVMGFPDLLKTKLKMQINVDLIENIVKFSKIKQILFQFLLFLNWC